MQARSPSIGGCYTELRRPGRPMESSLRFDLRTLRCRRSPAGKRTSSPLNFLPVFFSVISPFTTLQSMVEKFALRRLASTGGWNPETPSMCGCRRRSSRFFQSRPRRQTDRVALRRRKISRCAGNDSFLRVVRRGGPIISTPQLY